MERAFDEVAAALAAGELVGIFPEGRITADGELGPFRPGIARILERNPVPVVPMAVSGLWGSIFSRRDGQALSRPWKARPFRPVGIAVGVPVEATAATPEGLLQQVLALRGERR